jgi:Putative Actinobacterial Holin-X, holin superfamily III
MLTPAETSGVTPNGRPKKLGAAAKQVSEHAKALVGLEVELASLELKQKLASLGLGIGLLVAAAVVGLYVLGFTFATITAGLATFLPTWLALLIVTLFLLIVAALLAAIGIKRVQRGTPPVPEQAIEEAKRTSEALRGDATT